MLLERAATALAHEGKNPLHNMVLHLQLLGEKVREGGHGGAPAERHLQALRDGIGRVDALLKAFSDLASPRICLPTSVPRSRARSSFSVTRRAAGPWR